MKGLQLSEPVRLYSRRKLLSFVLFLVTNFSAILVPVQVSRTHIVVRRHQVKPCLTSDYHKHQILSCCQVFFSDPQREWGDFQLPNPDLATSVSFIHVNVCNQ